MQRLLFKILAPAFVFAAASVSELPASTFGGSTGPRQGADDNLQRIYVDGNTYRRLEGRVKTTGAAPLTTQLPPTPQDPEPEVKTFTVIKSEADNMVESNNKFLVAPRD